MSINLENVRTWTAALRTDREQATGALTRVTSSGARSDCCLGVGCQVAGVPAEEGSEDTLSGAHNLLYGRAGVSGMPPVEFHLWLGTVESPDERNEWGQKLVVGGRDVHIDLPEDLLDREGTRLSYTSFRGVGCSDMNDAWRLTFDQIADMIDYFGLLTLRGAER